MLESLEEANDCWRPALEDLELIVAVSESVPSPLLMLGCFRALRSPTFSTRASAAQEKLLENMMVEGERKG